MRKLYTQNSEVEKLLQDLLCSYDYESYRHTFYSIGHHLANVLNERINHDRSVALACASEDADWLAKGIVDNFKSSLDLCVYWSKRHNFGFDVDNNAIEFAEIEKAYEEIHEDIGTLIITKSIISSSCVIKSQIMRLTSRCKFDKIYIVSPVMYKDAEKNLKEEFPESLYNLFEFIYFAIDEDKDERGWVLPGIGGSVYEKLGIDSRIYYPEILEQRMR